MWQHYDIIQAAHEERIIAARRHWRRRRRAIDLETSKRASVRRGRVALAR